MKMNASKPATPSPLSTPAISHGASPSPAPGLPAADDVARKVAEARRLVAQAQSKLAVNKNPYVVGDVVLILHTVNNPFIKPLTRPGKSKAPPPEPAQQGAGLKMAAHPLLLDNTVPAPQSKKDRYKPMQPKFASIKVLRMIPV